MNVNRWRGQFGQPAIDEAELAKLPKLALFDFDAVRVEVEGAFTTMSGEKREASSSSVSSPTPPATDLR